ncbi:Abi family protein [Providencia sp. PROV188]|jgi:uncharacterized protein YutE (UPF0331/DUF86 family)|uniref:Abi family protein n=1 Tax=unclassified Providencia TaxID=2633465 RepID=UPI0012B5F2CA|nr:MULTISPECIES: Abi family protein [unclassified Providencia]MDR2243447.1 Abi family protein [Providencia alcalifaciens]MTC42042.1 Abi family protein [Providencia sp. wls1921]MTC78614.1 Abi family protein [Providencia sp. wls1916]WBM60190.1 Abi family protein [Providencia sp. PROV188]
MAESQVTYIYDSNINTIKENISDNRFSAYLKKAGFNEIYAFNLYLYNARISKAFLFPLHMLEVSLRNRINRIFKILYGDDWANQQAFRSNLTSESLNSLDTAFRRCDMKHTENVIAELSFDFWSNLFRAEYDRVFWQKNMKVLTPHHITTRKEFQKIIKNINKLRNRIAHYEPIHDLDISTLHSQVIDVINWISLETSRWVKHYSTVNEMLRTSPSPTGEPRPHFSERCDNDFIEINENIFLSEIPKARFILVKNKDGKVLSVLEHKDIFNFIINLIDVDGKSIAIDLTDYKFKNICKELSLNNNYHECGHEESFSKTAMIFKKSKSQFILVKRTDEIIGVISKSHRRY